MPADVPAPDHRGTPAGRPAAPATRDAAYFDSWYADMATSTTRDAVVARTLGLPPELRSTSLLTWDGIGEVAAQLRLPPDGLLLDLACGRGGYGTEVARRTGARLVGVDFSAVALQPARVGARALGEGRAAFRVGTLTATGLADGAVDGAMCVDAVQYGTPPLAVLVELRRVLAPGRRLVLSTWEPADRSDVGVPARLRAVDLRRDLPVAGFVDVEVQDRPDWRADERRMWEEAVAEPDVGDPALRALQAEGRSSLAAWDSLRRVFATATAPGRVHPPG